MRIVNTVCLFTGVWIIALLAPTVDLSSGTRMIMAFIGGGLLGQFASAAQR